MHKLRKVFLLGGQGEVNEFSMLWVTKKQKSTDLIVTNCLSAQYSFIDSCTLVEEMESFGKTALERFGKISERARKEFGTRFLYKPFRIVCQPCFRFLSERQAVPLTQTFWVFPNVLLVNSFQMFPISFRMTLHITHSECFQFLSESNLKIYIFL